METEDNSSPPLIIATDVKPLDGVPAPGLSPAQPSPSPYGDLGSKPADGNFSFLFPATLPFKLKKNKY